MSQAKLSLQAQVEQARISLIERNLVSPKPDEATAIAKILGIKESDLQKPIKNINPEMDDAHA